jgi:hypothetical protein
MNGTLLPDIDLVSLALFLSEAWVLSLHFSSTDLLRLLLYHSHEMLLGLKMIGPIFSC